MQNQTKIVLDDFVKEVRVANNAEDGIQMAINGGIDLIITDILMPDKNGIEMLKELRDTYAIEIPTIITTAFMDTEYLMEAIKLKVDGFIAKPINIKDLINSIYGIVLPKIQEKKLKGCTYMLDALSVVIGGKKIEILKHIVNNLDEEHIFYGSYEEIMKIVGVSKPTVVNIFKQLIKAGVLEKVKNKIYRFKSIKFIKEET